MQYLLVLLVLTACTAPKAEPKKEAAVEAQETAADTPADIRNNRPDDIGAGGVFDADKMWGDKNPRRTLPDGRVLSYTNGYGIELVNLEQVMTDIEIAEFFETNKGINNSALSRKYSWYYRSSGEIGGIFWGDPRIYLMELFFYNYVRNYTLRNARNIEVRLNADSLIPVAAETLYKGFPKLHTKAVQEAINIYIKQINEPPNNIIVYGLPVHIEEGWVRENWPILSFEEGTGLFSRAVRLAELLNGLAFDNSVYIEYTKSPAELPKYYQWISRNFYRLNLQIYPDAALDNLTPEDKEALKAAEEEFRKQSQQTRVMGKARYNLLNNLLLMYVTDLINQDYRYLHYE